MYNKPKFLFDDTIQEGVYAASESAAYVLTDNGSQIPGAREYRIALTNTGSEPVDVLTVTIQLSGNVTLVRGTTQFALGSITGVVNGNSAVLTCKLPSGSFEPGKTYSTGTLHIEGNGEVSAA